MKRIANYSALTPLPAADMNGIQDRAVGLVKSDASGNDLTALADGMQGILFQMATAGGLANATLIQVDAATIDWKDRFVWGTLVRLTSDNERIGQSVDYRFGYGATITHFAGYTGLQALSNVTTGAAVSNGNPPLHDTGAGGTSWAVDITSNIHLYTQDSKLYLYNNSGATIYPVLIVFASGDTGKR